MKTTVRVNDDFYIEIDALNFALNQRTYDKENKPTDNFRPIGYFNNVIHALKAVERIEESELGKTMDLTEYIKELEALQNRYTNNYKAYKEEHKNDTE